MIRTKGCVAFSQPPSMATTCMLWQLALGLILTSMAFSSTAEATVLHVPDDVPTIQGCIDSAVDGDECIVAPGTYNELINLHGKAITLRSADGPDVTIIDAAPVAESPDGKPVIRCGTGEGPDTILDGFTITGGTGSICYGTTTCGGGMYNNGTSPTVTHCTFVANSAAMGGGMFNDGASPTVANCTFSDNSASQGGGMDNLNSSLTATDCTFSGNSAIGSYAWGGGMHNSLSNPTLAHCNFLENSANDGGARDSGIPNSVSQPTMNHRTLAAINVGDGGGMANLSRSDPTVTNCTFVGNTAIVRGGAMYNSHSSNPTVTYCTFSENSVDFLGGGMYNYNSSPAVNHCTFSGNAGESGGGMFNHTSTPTVIDCRFLQNLAAGRFGTGTGGGMYNSHHSSATVTDCLFLGNSASGDFETGGGMVNSSSNPVVTNCTFSGNTAIGDFGSGGGMQNYNSHPEVTNCRFNANSAQSGGGMVNSSSNPKVTNCTFAGNSAQSGGGMYSSNGSSPTLTNCTISGNSAVSGGGMFTTDEFGEPSTPVLNNCVTWGNAPDQIANDFGAVTTVRHSNVQGGIPVGMVDAGGNIDTDPMFVRNPSDGGDGWGDDPDTPDVDEGTNDDFGDLRLLFGSPCIDAGDNTALPPDALDLDGDGDTLEAIPFDLDAHARVLCTVVDMGAYESGIGDDDCNGLVDVGDFAAYVDCLTGPAGGLLPGCEPFDFNGHARVDLADLAGFQRVFTGPP